MNSDCNNAYKEFHEERRLKLAVDIEVEVAKRVADGFEASGAIIRESMFKVLEHADYREELVFEKGWNSGRKELLLLIKEMIDDWKDGYSFDETGILIERVFVAMSK